MVRRKQLEDEDPLVMKITEEESINIEYLEMLNALKNNVETKDLPDDNELRQLSGCKDQISMVTLKDGTKLIIIKWNWNIDPEHNEVLNVLRTLERNVMKWTANISLLILITKSSWYHKLRRNVCNLWNCLDSFVLTFSPAGMTEQCGSQVVDSGKVIV